MSCGENWRLEYCDLRTGRVRGVLRPVSFEFESRLNDFGQGQITMAVKDVTPRMVWPDLTSVYFLRTSGGGATNDNPVCEFAGIVREYSSTDTAMIGLKEITSYLTWRVLTDGANFDNMSQNVISRSLVDEARNGGIPLYGQESGSAFNRDRNWDRWDYKNIGQAVQQLTEVIDGNDWELRHEKIGGAWRTTMIFRDYVGVERDVLVRSDRETTEYSIRVDASDHATWVVGTGAGEEADQLWSGPWPDPANIYPRFDAIPNWPDVSLKPTLDAHAKGYLRDHQEPVATPEVTIRGVQTPDPALMRNGDSVLIDLNNGLTTYKGRCRIISQSWSASADEAESRSYELLPLDRASESVLNQVARDNCPPDGRP